MSREVPLQSSLFSDDLVDTRSRTQKRKTANIGSTRQTEMFSQRDVAQFGVRARPQLPVTARNGKGIKMALEMQDPRTEEEKRAAQQRTAEKLTGQLFQDSSTPVDAKRVYRQWLDLSQQFPQAIVMCKMGDFFETFDASAEMLANELGIVLTSRNVGKDVRVKMVGIPIHALDGYVARLVGKGHHVALCDQVGEENGRVVSEATGVEIVGPTRRV